MNLKDVRALILHRGWLMVSGAGTVLLIPQTLSAPEQGLFFTFLSLAAIQSVFEAGITSVFFNYTAHERALLTATPPLDAHSRGKAQCRLDDLVRMARRWFHALALIFILVIGPVGFYFIDAAVDRESIAIHWQSPYLLLIAAISLSLINFSRIPILEGYGQIAQVAQFRLRSSVLSILVLWGGMAFGWGLWALAFSYMLQNISMAIQISRASRDAGIYRQSLEPTTKQDTLNWRVDILPVQLRLAGSYFCGYFIAQAVVPFTLHYQGTTLAGQLGLIMSVFNALAAIVASYMYAAAPKYAEHIAHRNYETLKKLFSKVTMVTLIAALAVYACVLMGTWLAKYFELPIANSMASTEVVFWMAVIGMVNAYGGSVATLLRAQKKDPMLPMSIAVALGYILVMVTLRGASMEKLFLAFTIVQLFVALPIIILTLRKSGLLTALRRAS